MAHPTKRTKKLEADLCKALTEGTTLSEWCRRSERHPSRFSVLRWMREDDELAQRIARAREEGAWAIEDEMQVIADRRNIDDPDDVAHRKLQLWMREKRLVWSCPAKYSQKVQAQIDASTTNVVVLSDAERAVRIQQLLDKAKGIETSSVEPRRITAEVHDEPTNQE